MSLALLFEGKLIPEQSPGETNPLFQTAINLQHPNPTRSRPVVLQPVQGYHTTPADPHRNTNTHRTRYVITNMHDIRIYSGNIIKNTQHTRELKNLKTPQQPIFTETSL